MEEIRKIIEQKLDEIEEKEQIKILHCVESGSRAWGFPSPDSDYDVRFIYVRPREFYLRLDKTRDVVEWQLDETLDINGWDLQKALRLLYKSNPTLFEWQNSPIVYRTSSEWAEFVNASGGYFSLVSGIYHYLSTARGNYREYLKGDKVKIKKYFYVLRPLLACEYIRDKGVAPPMFFEALLPYLPASVLPEVERLLKIKAVTSELGEGERIDCLNQYIEEKIQEFEAYAATLTVPENPGWERLNQLFLSMVNQ